MNRIWGIVTLLIAIAVAVVPVYTACPTNMMVMKCHWTVQAEIAAAMPIFVLGLLLIFNRSKESFRALSLVGAASGIAVILIPTLFIGTCAAPMKCATLLKPIVISLGALLIAGNLGLLFYAWKGIKD
jgi:hypothetical protein